MAREEVGCYFHHNREAALFQPLKASAPSTGYNLNRLIKICLPIKYQFCFSNHHQRLLFHLLDACKSDAEIHGKVMPSIIQFIERADPNDPLWISCCESGFAFNIIKKTIAVAQADDRDAIAGFLVHKMHEMSQLLHSEASAVQESAKVLIQEIFHSIAASPDADWLYHQDKISAAVRNSLSACIPFNTPVSACLAMKTLLCAREVSRQLVFLAGKMSVSEEEEDDDTVATLAQYSFTLESLYDSVEVLLHNEIEIDRSALVKVAIQIQLSCCRLSSVPLTFFEKTTQHVIAYLESHDANAMHRALILEAQSLYAVENAGASKTNARVLISKRDIDSLDEVYSILRAFIGTALTIKDDHIRQKSLYDVSVATSKLISSSLGSSSPIEQQYLLDDGLLPSSGSNVISSSVQLRHLTLQAVGMIRKFVRQAGRLLQLVHVEVEDPSQSPSSILIGNCMALVESHIFKDSTEQGGGSMDQCSVSVSEASLIFLSMLSRAIRHIGIKEQIYRFLFKVSQKRIQGSMLLLVVSSLAQMMTTEGHVLGFSIHAQHSSPVEDLPHLMSLLLKLEERVLHQCKESMVTALEQQPSDHHSLATVNRATFQGLRSKVRGIFHSITIVARSLLYEGNKTELEVRFGMLVERFLAIMIELIPIVHGKTAASEASSSSAATGVSSTITAVTEFITEIIVMNLESVAATLEGINELTINSVNSADGVQLQDDTFGNLSKYIRLWVGLTVGKVKIPSSVKSTFDNILAKIARSTPPLVFGKFLGISKSTDLADELIVGDPTLSEVVSKCLLLPDKTLMQSNFGFPPNGLSTASFFYLHAFQQLEVSRVSSSIDIRPTVGYFSDLAHWTSAPKQKIIKKIAKQIEDRWLEAVNHQLLSFDAIQEDQEILNESHHLDQRGSVGGGSTLFHIQLATNSTISNASVTKYTLPQFNRLLMDQVLFLVERIADDRDHVRFFCAKLLIRMISELPWMVSAFPATHLLTNALEALAAIEVALHTSSAYNPYDSTTAKPSIPGESNLANDANDEPIEISEEGGELFLMTPITDDTNRFISRHEMMQHRSLQRQLSMKALLPPLSFPLREDRLQAISFDLMIVIYYWLSFTGLSLTLKEALLTGYLEKYAKKRLPSSIATQLVVEMLSNSRPLYQHIKSAAAGNGGESNEATGGAFSQVRAQAVQQVQHLLENRKKAQSATTLSSVSSGISSDRLFDNTGGNSFIGKNKTGVDGNQDSSGDTISHSVLSLLGNTTTSDVDGSVTVSSDRTTQRRLITSFRELVDHAAQNLSITSNSKSVLQVIIQLEDFLHLLKKEQRANSRLWPVSILQGELSRVVDILTQLLQHFSLNVDISQRIYDTFRRSLTLFPQFQAYLWTLFLTNLDKFIYSAIISPMISTTSSHGKSSTSFVRGIFSSMQYPLQLLSLALDGRLGCTFHMARITAQSILFQVDNALQNMSFAISEHVLPAFLTHMDVLSTQVLMISSFKVLRMFHLLKGNVPVACNRILRESLYATMLWIQPTILDQFDISEGTLVQSDRHSAENVSSVATNVGKSSDESHERIRECVYWCQMMRDLLEDRVRWTIDYDRTAQQQHRFAQSQQNARLSTIATMSQEEEAITGEQRQSSSGLQGHNSTPNEVLTTTLPAAIYYGGEAATDIVLIQTCRFQSALKKLPGFLPNPVVTASLAANAPILNESQCSRHRKFTLGIIDNIPQASGLQTNAKKLESLLEQAGLLTAWLLLIIRRMDAIIARYLCTYQDTIHLDSPHQQQALAYIQEIQSLLDTTALSKDIKSYKNAIKSLWNFHPSLVLTLQTQYQELSLEDGKRKGVSHPHMFIFMHLMNHRTHGIQSNLRQHGTHLVSKLLDLMTNPLVYTDPDRMSQVWYMLDILPVAPMHIVLRHLARCQCFTTDNQTTDAADISGDATGAKQRLSGWMRYVQRCLLHTDKDIILFYLPELVQLLRQDLTYGVLETCLRDIAASSPMLCHQLIWLLQTESTSNTEEQAMKRLLQQQKRHKFALSETEQQQIVNKNAKYGFCGQLPGIDPLPSFSRHLVDEITQALPDNQYNYLRNELAFFNFITDISHQLKSVKSKDQHNTAAKVLLQQVKHIPEGIYLPTRPYRRIQAIDMDSATPMQSAAKCPFLLKFVTIQWKGPDAYLDAITARHLLVRTPSRVFKSSQGHTSSVKLPPLLPPVPPVEETSSEAKKTDEEELATESGSSVVKQLTFEDTTDPPQVPNPVVLPENTSADSTTLQTASVNAAVDNNIQENASVDNGSKTVQDGEQRGATDENKQLPSSQDTAAAIADAEIESTSQTSSEKKKKHRNHAKKVSSHVDHNQSLHNLLDEDPSSKATNKSPSRAQLASIGRSVSVTQKVRITVAEDDLSDDDSESGSDDDASDSGAESDKKNTKTTGSTAVLFATAASDGSTAVATAADTSIRRGKADTSAPTAGSASSTPAAKLRKMDASVATRFTSPAKLKPIATTNGTATKHAQSTPAAVASTATKTITASSIYRHHIALESHDENYQVRDDQEEVQGFDACIFKVHDDCRQDLLTLQVIQLLHNCFTAQHLPIFLMPYRIICNRTGQDGNIGGILQVVNNVSSRDQLGKAGAKTLMQYFIAKFGAIGSEAFHTAQLSFARSVAAYAVICYLLHIKDRHNGNILFDERGHLIHIDFGFILGISPGKNLGFEKAPFKLSQEMVELMGGPTSEVFKQFKILTIQCFLSARQVMDVICAMVCSFADSELPCFQYKAHILYRLRRRFVPEKNDIEAALFMSAMVDAAAQDWTSSAYDGVQKLQNNIYSPEWK